MSADGPPPGPSFRVGLATPSDREALLAVWRAAILARRRGRAVPADVEARVRQNLAAPEAMAVMAREGERVVGMALGLPGRADDGAGETIAGLCHVASVYVLPERWGLGLGRVLLEELLRAARRRGYVRAQLWTQADNGRALALYRRLGFALTGREKVDGDLGDRILHLERDPL